MSDTVLLERTGRTATLTLNRPPLHILDLATLARLNELIGRLAVDPDLQVVVLRGAGERAFSAGVSVQDHTPDKVREMLDGLHGAIRGLRDLPAVAVAAVQGHCLGGGMELALGCDLVLATDDARFGQPEIELGCYPPAAAALYPRLLGTARTLELLLSGRTLSCEEAERLGLVTWRVEAGGLDLGIARVLADLTAKSAAVTRLTKRAVSAGRDLPFDAAIEETEQIYLQDLCATADMEEGLTAFLEKRKPVWQHR
ncbi:MAG: cyclohexa,5-dienecarbonyl-CoA hydratase [Acidobacteriota bacterium]|jgi:cyclohexa-1,5-dienecarbonyl-CoA hydratase|nr:cyclohexa,5-dienecarbonyl-CoA hydratase [Acidobacteriota bacterium]